MVAESSVDATPGGRLRSARILQRESILHEANVPAESDSTEAHAWLPGPNEHEGGKGCLEAAPVQRAPAPRGNDPREVVVAGVGQRFPRSERVRDGRDYGRASRYGRRVASAHFVILLNAKRHEGAKAGGARLGVTVSRKVGPAVERNRVKRGIREWYRRQRELRVRAVDIVVIARKGAATLRRLAIEEELENLLKGEKW